ncbi:MAG TPA: hypothetical protein VF066_08070 [Thermoleophilaceae bacterium]
MRIAALLLLGCLLAVPAVASPQTDFNAVYGDWKKDSVITRCSWSQAQLQNAYDIARSNPDFQYETEFVDDTQAEIKRWKNGGCAGIQPLSVRKKSPLYGVRIVAVRGKGSRAKETVTIRNTTRRTVSFRKASLTNFKGKGFYFPTRFKLARGRTIVVHIGCAKGRRGTVITRRAAWFCRPYSLFRDKGDLARLADAKLLVVSQRGFGDQASRPVF